MLIGKTSISQKLNNLSSEAIKKALTKSALLVEADAKINCPVDTGLLRSSITHNVYDDYAEVGTNYSYAPYIEHGTGLFAEAGNGRQTPWSYQDADGQWHTTIGQQPQPFLRPALDANKQKIEQIFQDEIQSGG